MSQEASADAGLVRELGQASKTVKAILDEIGRSVIGQNMLRRRLLTGLITQGHVLLEGVPGLAKTRSIKALAEAVDASFQRIQFTPDLLPADLIGTEIFRPRDGTFEVRKGPVFANFVLADEINRAPAKVQSALLEAMEEGQVTIGEKTLAIPKPFFVMATQNPIEQEGTYPLPEAQIDRFMMKVKVDYPSPEEERRMLDLISEEQLETRPAKAVVGISEILHLRQLCSQVYVDNRVKQYIVDLVWATRTPEKFGLKCGELIELGASPRAAISLLQAARAEALLEEEHYVVPQHIKDVAPDVLRHRIVPTYEAEAQGLSADDLVKIILDGVQVP